MTRQFGFPAFLAFLMGSILSFSQPAMAASSTTTTLAVFPTSAATGSFITVTLTKGGTTLLGTTVLSASGTATYTTSVLPVGANAPKLNYSGDTNYF